MRERGPRDEDLDEDDEDDEDQEYEDDLLKIDEDGVTVALSADPAELDPTLDDRFLMLNPVPKPPRINPWTLYLALFWLIPASIGIYLTFAFARISQSLTLAAAVGFALGPILFALSGRARERHRATNSALLRGNTETLALHASSLAGALKFLGTLAMAPEVFLIAYDFPIDPHVAQKAQVFRGVLWGVFGVFALVTLELFVTWVDVRAKVKLDAKELSIRPDKPVQLKEINRIRTEFGGLNIQLYNPPSVIEAAAHAGLSEKRRLVTFQDFKLPVAAEDLAQAVAKRVKAVWASGVAEGKSGSDRLPPPATG
jgi:hypothetical protein